MTPWFVIQIKTNCSSEEPCSWMNCSMSSIADTCFSLHLLAEVDQLSEEIGDTNPGRDNTQLIPQWLAQLLDVSLPTQEMANTLKAVLKIQAYVDCNFSYEGHDTAIECLSI